MMRENTVICLSTIDWSYAKQRHQLFMEHFAARGKRVIFVEHLGFSRQSLRDIGNIAARLVRIFAFGRRRLPTALPENLTVLTPLVLPPTNRVFDFLNAHIFLVLLARRLRVLGSGRPLVWTYLATSTAVTLIEKLDASRVVYDCVYDALRHPAAPPRIRETERRLLARADLVITDAAYLFREKQKLHPRVVRIPPGVDFEKFHASDPATPADIADLARLPRPRAVFFGCIGKEQNRIDLPLLADVALGLPDWSIVFIGPVVDMKIPDHLQALPNLHWLGFKAYERLPSYLAACDVIIFPYLLNDFTASMFPAKVFESLATGKPVVSTPLPELAPFAEVIALAPDRRAFREAIRNATGTENQQKRAQRLALAREHTWKARFAHVRRILDNEEFSELSPRRTCTSGNES